MQVLVVEDNPTNHMILRRILEKQGYTAKVAENGVEALEHLNASHFDVILMDCHMPEMDGFEATKQIRKTEKDFRDLPIIAVTANSMPGDREKCLACGMDDYIAKPYSKDVLLQKVSHWLHQNAA